MQRAVGDVEVGAVERDGQQALEAGTGDADRRGRPRRRSNSARIGRTPSRVRASHSAAPVIFGTGIASSAAVNLRQTAS